MVNMGYTQSHAQESSVMELHGQEPLMILDLLGTVCGIVHVVLIQSLINKYKNGGLPRFFLHVIPAQARTPSQPLQNWSQAVMQKSRVNVAHVILRIPRDPTHGMTKNLIFWIRADEILCMGGTM